MKVRVTFKTPYAADQVRVPAARAVMCTAEGSDEETAAQAEQEVLESLVNRFFRCGECITVELDTEAKTCVVVPRAGA